MMGIKRGGALKCVLRNRELRINAKKCLSIAREIIIAWGMRNAERRKVKVLEMKCLGSLV